MVIRVLDYVKQCYTQEDGETIYSLINGNLKSGEKVILSFDGVEYVPSSFVNASLITLLDEMPFDAIRSRLSFVDTTKQINEMIKTRFAFETNRRSHAVA